MKYTSLLPLLTTIILLILSPTLFITPTHSQTTFRFKYVITLTTTLDKVITREDFFNSNHPWYHEDLVTSFNQGMFEYINFSSPTTASGLFQFISRWKNRQSIVLTMIMDKPAFDNIWTFVGSNAGAQALIPIFNTARNDNTEYEFREVSVTSSQTFSQFCLSDGIDGNETDLNCGGSDCISCDGGKKCKVDTDCIGGVCQSDLTCKDFVNNSFHMNNIQSFIYIFIISCGTLFMMLW